MGFRSGAGLAISSLILVLPLTLAACKQEAPKKPAEPRPVRSVIVDPKPVDDDRQAIGEIRPRYESDLSFRVAGKLLERAVDVGTVVKSGDVIARLDGQDYQNRLRSAEADVAASQAALVEAQGTEERQGKLLKDGYTPKANYDTALRNLRSAEAKMASSVATLDLTRDQLNYTTLKVDFDGVITAIAAEPGQNVAAGQMVVRIAKPDDKDAVFSIPESAFRNKQNALPDLTVTLLSSPDVVMEATVREVSPVADPVTRTYLAKATLKGPPPQVRFGMSVSGRLKAATAPVVVLPLAALFNKDNAPAVWLVDPATSTVKLHPVKVSRYEADQVVIDDGLAKGNVVVTAGVNLLREGQKVRLSDGGAGK